MSNQSNTNWAEGLAERLEGLGQFMNPYQFEDYRNELIRLLAAGEFYEADDWIYKLECEYMYDKARERVETMDEAYDTF